MVDWFQIRRDFPILKKTIYLDSAATSLTPEPVVDVLSNFYLNLRANVHRGVYKLSSLTTQYYNEAHVNAAEIIGGNDPEEISFTYNTTYATNLIALGLKWQKGDKIVTSPIEHHSNLLPWQDAMQRVDGSVEFLKINPDGSINLDNAEEIIKGSRLVTLTLNSNVLGTKTPVDDVIKIAKDYGALVLIDAAQAVGHFPVDVKKLGCDFLVYSAHKGVMGPLGIGVLYSQKDSLKELKPPFVGGGMIEDVWLDKYTYAKLPDKFEAGTPNIGGAIALSRAVEYVLEIGINRIEQREKMLVTRMLNGLKNIDNVEIYGPLNPSLKTGLVSFNIKNMESFDVGVLLDQTANIAVRTGHHCAMPLHESLELTGSVRASLHCYNNEKDVDTLIKTVQIISDDLS